MPDPNAPILLFNGTGTSPNDVAAIEAILRDRGLVYATANSAQLDAMSNVQLQRYRLLVVPGGNYIEMGEGLSAETAAKVRRAVEKGLHYLGICAGGILAGDGPHRHFNLTAGVKFEFYAVVNQGIHKTAVEITSPDGTAIEHYWEDGPQLAGWGAVVAKYPDGTPAVVQGVAGKGWVILCGTHPEAPANWRAGMTFAGPVEESNAYAAKLIDAGLYGTELPHF